MVLRTKLKQWGHWVAKAKALIGGGKYNPQKLAVLYQAFDQAWKQIAPTFGARADAVEAARLKLANIVIGLAGDDDGVRDADALAKEAVTLMAQPST